MKAKKKSVVTVIAVASLLLFTQVAWCGPPVDCWSGSGQIPNYEQTYPKNATMNVTLDIKNPHVAGIDQISIRGWALVRGTDGNYQSRNFDILNDKIVPGAAHTTILRSSNGFAGLRKTYRVDFNAGCMGTVEWEMKWHSSVMGQWTPRDKQTKRVRNNRKRSFESCDVRLEVDGAKGMNAVYLNCQEVDHRYSDQF